MKRITVKRIPALYGFAMRYDLYVNIDREALLKRAGELDFLERGMLKSEISLGNRESHVFELDDRETTFFAACFLESRTITTEVISLPAGPMELTILISTGKAPTGGMSISAEIADGE